MLKTYRVGCTQVALCKPDVNVYSDHYTRWWESISNYCLTQDSLRHFATTPRLCSHCIAGEAFQLLNLKLHDKSDLQMPKPLVGSTIRCNHTIGCNHRFILDGMSCHIVDIQNMKFAWLCMFSLPQHRIGQEPVPELGKDAGENLLLSGVDASNEALAGGTKETKALTTEF